MALLNQRIRELQDSKVFLEYVRDITFRGLSRTNPRVVDVVNQLELVDLELALLMKSSDNNKRDDDDK